MPDLGKDIGRVPGSNAAQKPTIPVTPNSAVRSCGPQRSNSTELGSWAVSSMYFLTNSSSLPRADARCSTVFKFGESLDLKKNTKATPPTANSTKPRIAKQTIPSTRYLTARLRCVGWAGFGEFNGGFAGPGNCGGGATGMAIGYLSAAGTGFPKGTNSPLMVLAATQLLLPSSKTISVGRSCPDAARSFSCLSDSGPDRCLPLVVTYQRLDIVDSAASQFKGPVIWSFGEDACRRVFPPPASPIEQDGRAMVKKKPATHGRGGGRAGPFDIAGANMPESKESRQCWFSFRPRGCRDRADRCPTFARIIRPTSFPLTNLAPPRDRCLNLPQSCCQDSWQSLRFECRSAASAGHAGATLQRFDRTPPLPSDRKAKALNEKVHFATVACSVHG